MHRPSILAPISHSAFPAPAPIDWSNSSNVDFTADTIQFLVQKFMQWPSVPTSKPGAHSKDKHVTTYRQNVQNSQPQKSAVETPRRTAQLEGNMNNQDISLKHSDMSAINYTVHAILPLLVLTKWQRACRSTPCFTCMSPWSICRKS